jgi:hypothetical protein
MAEILIARDASVFRKVIIGLVIFGVIALGVHAVLSPDAIPVAQSVWDTHESCAEVRLMHAPPRVQMMERTTPPSTRSEEPVVPEDCSELT